MCSTARKAYQARRRKRLGLDKRGAILSAVAQKATAERKQELTETLRSEALGLASGVKEAKGYIATPEKGETHETLRVSVSRVNLVNNHEGANVITRRGATCPFLP